MGGGTRIRPRFDFGACKGVGVMQQVGVFYCRVQWRVPRARVFSDPVAGLFANMRVRLWFNFQLPHGCHFLTLKLPAALLW